MMFKRIKKFIIRENAQIQKDDKEKKDRIEIKQKVHASGQRDGEVRSISIDGGRNKRNKILRNPSQFLPTNPYLGYNADLTPPQNPILRMTKTLDVLDPILRENLLLSSAYLRAHTYTLFRDILKNGFESSRKLPELPQSLITAIIDGTVKAWVLGTSYILGFDDNEKKDKEIEKYLVFTQNDEKRVYINPLRQISEIYLQMPAWENAYLDFQEKDTISSVATIGALTQFTDDKERKNRFKGLKDQKEIQGDELVIKRNAVVIQPISSLLDVHGSPGMLIAAQTAIEKLYVRFAAIMILTKGGSQNMAFLPEFGNLQNLDLMEIRKSMERGIFSRGTVYFVNGITDNLENNALIRKKPLPGLEGILKTINDQLSEDAEISQQALTGKAESGALGGVAPEINQEEDSKIKKAYSNSLKQVICDVYKVFYDLDVNPSEIELKTNNKIIDTPKPVIPQDDNEKKIEEIDEKEQPTEEIDGKINQAKNSLGNFTLSDLMIEKMLQSLEISSENHSITGSGDVCEGKLMAHSINDNFKRFRGNLLQVGLYHYPDEDNRSVIYTSEDIRTMTERNIRTGPLEINHSDNNLQALFDEDIGYFEIRGMEKDGNKDITDFFIKESAWEQLGRPETIKVSPKFIYSEKDGRKTMQVVNAAIVTKGIPRAELTGLKSEAKLKE